MSDRYIARVWDTCGDVWDTQTRRVVSSHDLISDAEAEAARLNAAAPKRAARADLYAPISPQQVICFWMAEHSKHDARQTAGQLSGGRRWEQLAALGWRIARVRIEEIEE